MIQIKNYFTNWNAARIIRLILAVALAIGYFSTKETIYLFGALVFGAQAIFNMSCPGGSCATPNLKKDEQVVKVEEYKPKK